jgi:uncharacterized integral membrane protein (TIGR00698 family)
MMTLSIAVWHARGRKLFPGVFACAAIAVAATFLSRHYGVPVMLFALILGMAMNFLSGKGSCQPGIEFAARNVLRWGVALLGLRITTAQVVALGWESVFIVAISLILTIAMSMVVARLMGFHTLFGLLSGGATAICGASAALALSAALPPHPLKERATLFTVVSVSALSTFTMILYPMLARALGLDDVTAGIFLGATIHDVAQVVGAAYGMSQPVGDTATLVKLMRVACLLPVILFAVMYTRATGEATGEARPPLLPWFAVGFAALMVINSTGWLPTTVSKVGSDLSGWFLVASMVGIGMKTRLRELVAVGLKPVLLMLGETAFLAVLALALLRWVS